MSPEELDEARAKEVLRICPDMTPDQQNVARRAIGQFVRLARENWTPPEPVVDPDLRAFREWLANDHEADGWTGGATLCRLGRHDGSEEARAFLAGARMAREQERERAGPLVEFAVALETFGLDDSISAIPRGAREVLAKYRGEA